MTLHTLVTLLCPSVKVLTFTIPLSTSCFPSIDWSKEDACYTNQTFRTTCSRKINEFYRILYLDQEAGEGLGRSITKNSPGGSIYFRCKIHHSSRTWGGSISIQQLIFITMIYVDHYRNCFRSVLLHGELNNHFEESDQCSDANMDGYERCRLANRNWSNTRSEKKYELQVAREKTMAMGIEWVMENVAVANDKHPRLMKFGNQVQVGLIQICGRKTLVGDLFWGTLYATLQLQVTNDMGVLALTSQVSKWFKFKITDSCRWNCGQDL